MSSTFLSNLSFSPVPFSFRQGGKEGKWGIWCTFDEGSDLLVDPRCLCETLDENGLFSNFFIPEEPGSPESLPVEDIHIEDPPCVAETYIWEIPLEGHTGIALHFVEETQLMRLILIFTAVALLISLLGLVAMSTYYIQQRRREIAVRKVFGSKSRQVLIRLVRLFMLYVGIAAIIAIPIIYYIGNDWLSQFSYRIILSWWIYVLAIFITALASFLAVILQSWHAANANPVESIKQE